MDHITEGHPGGYRVAVVECRPHLRPRTLVGYVSPTTAVRWIDILEEVIRRHSHAESLAVGIPPYRVRPIPQTRQMPAAVVPCAPAVHLIIAPTFVLS